MCQSQALGGLRCAGSTKPRFEHALKEILKCSTPNNALIAELQLAASAYASTPSGSTMVATVADTLWATEPVKQDIAMALEMAAQVGKKNREIAKDVARITKAYNKTKGIAEEKEGNITCLPEETLNSLKTKIVQPQKFSAVDWLENHNHEGRMNDLWGTLKKETDIEGRHEARTMLRTIKEEDLATYLIAKDEDGLDEIIVELSNKLDMSVEKITTLVNGALRRHLRTRMGKDKVDFIKKMQNKAVEGGVQSAWAFQMATMSEIETWAIFLAKDSTRRSRYESVATAFIRSRTGLTTIQMSSPTINVAAIRFTKNGGIKVSNGKEEGHCKSADIAVIQDDGQKVKVVLAGHKFAQTGGGAQDNQWADAKTYLNNSLAAQHRGTDIPGLRTAVSALLGRQVAREDFSWEPALILDGAYYKNAPTIIKSDKTRPLLNKTTAFVGNTDDFVTRFGKGSEG